MNKERHNFTDLAKIGCLGTERIMRLLCVGDTVYRTWGQAGGEMQDTSNTYDAINVGKANELSPEEAAFADYDRKINKHLKEGYKVVRSNTHKNSAIIYNFEQEMKLGNRAHIPFIPPAFCASKPTAKITSKKEEYLDELFKSGRAVAFAKYNGICHFILVNENGLIIIYTRRLNNHTRKYPAIVAEFEKMDLPRNTIWMVEFHVSTFDNHILNFKRMSEISKLDTLKGEVKANVNACLKKQIKNTVRVAVLACLYYDSQPVCNDFLWDDSYMVHVHKPLLTYANKYGAPVHFHVMQSLGSTSVQETKNRLEPIQTEMEGAVIWMLDENIEISWDGKPKRRAGFKVIIPNTIDMVATGWKPGKGDRQNKVGSVQISEYNEKGELVDCGWVGSGIKDDEAEPGNWEFPCVVEIEYTNRFPTGKFQHPRFNKIHENKTVEEMRRTSIDTRRENGTIQTGKSGSLGLSA